MAFLAFVLAAIEFALVAFGVDFPADSAIENLAAGLFLVALGLALPGVLTVYHSRGSAG
ncbi:MAG TPA: hypothetical protein VNC18_17645 [Gemmatimonadaceae bacterium]|nr:hypothetical protein [Gemmatimonadaceae bacterium]